MKTRFSARSTADLELWEAIREVLGKPPLCPDHSPGAGIPVHRDDTYDRPKHCPVAQ